MNQSVTSTFELYLQRSDLRNNSISVKRRALAYFVRWFGDMPVGQVTAAVGEDYKVLAAKGRSASAANTYINNFKPFWKWLHAHGRISTNPFAGIKPYKVMSQPKQYFEAMDLVKMARFFDVLWRVRVALGLLGCRRGMMMNVLVRELHMDSATPHVEITGKTKSAHTWPWNPKDYGVTYIGLPETIDLGGEVLMVHRDIVTLIDNLPVKQPYLCLTSGQYQRMINKQASGTLTQEDINDPVANFQRQFNLRQRRAGIVNHKRFHELRAAYITHMIDRVGIRRAQQAVGHKSVQTTAAYDRTEIMKTVEMSNKEVGKFYKSIVL